MKFDHVIFTFDYVPAEDCIRLMLARTSEHGSLVMPGWSDEISMEKYWLWLRMKWTEEDAEQLVKEFHTLRKQIELFAAIKDKDSVGTVINAYEKKLRMSHPMLLRSAERLYRLIELEAPEVVINHEAGWLAQVLAVCRFAESLEHFKTVEEAMKPIEYEEKKYKNNGKETV